MIIQILIYLSGCVTTYILCKNVMFRSRRWTVSDRRVGLLFSAFSWVGVFSVLVTTWVTSENDKPAKW